MIASTFENNDSTLQTVSNGFGFVGLSLDILGTTFGVLHALRLQKPTPQMPEQLQIKRLQHEMGNWPVLVDMAQALRADLSARQKFWNMRRYFVNDESLNRHLQLLFEEQRSPTILWYCRNFVLGVDNGDAMLGGDPVFAIGAGAACLLVSVLVLAVSSQPRTTWVTCASITVIVTLSMTMGLFAAGTGGLCLFSYRIQTLNLHTLGYSPQKGRENFRRRGWSFWTVTHECF
jgi:hypothetical protein